MSNWLGDEIPQPTATSFLATRSLKFPEPCTRQPQYLRARQLRLTDEGLVKTLGPSIWLSLSTNLVLLSDLGT